MIEGQPTDESHAASKDKDPIQGSDLDKLVRFISVE